MPPTINTTSTDMGFDFQVLLSPANTQQVQQLLRHVTQGEISNPVLNKLGKAVIRAMADSSIQSITNVELVELNRRRKEKVNRSAAYYGSYVIATTVES